MITTVRSHKKFYPQTIESLKYSSNARSIQNDPSINSKSINDNLSYQSIDKLQVY